MPPKRDSDQACEGLPLYSSKSGVNVTRSDVLTKGFIIRRNLAINLGTDFPDAVRVMSAYPDLQLESKLYLLLHSILQC